MWQSHHSRRICNGNLANVLAPDMDCQFAVRAYYQKIPCQATKAMLVICRRHGVLASVSCTVIVDGIPFAEVQAHTGGSGSRRARVRGLPRCCHGRDSICLQFKGWLNLHRPRKRDALLAVTALAKRRARVCMQRTCAVASAPCGHAHVR